MAIKIYKQETQYDYIPVEERAEKNPTIFVIRPLSREEQARLEDNILKVDATQGYINMANASYLLKAFVLGVKDIKNIVDEKGKEVKPVFTSNGIDTGFLDMLPDDLIKEVAEVIVNISKYPQDIDVYLGNKTEDKEEK